MTTDGVPQGPSAQDIESALKKTGFLLEHRVAQSLRNNHHRPDVTIADAYPDSESGKSREIDVYADFYDFMKRQPSIDVQVSVCLVIECKNSSGPFVLIGDSEHDYPSAIDMMVTSFDPFSLGFEKAVWKRLSREKWLYELPRITKSDFTGRQLLRLNLQGGAWRADNNSVYDSILYPLAKAWKHKMDKAERDAEEEGEEAWQIPLIRYIFPVIVTSGDLYTVDATSNDLDIKQVKWTNIKRSFESKEIKGNFWADVVSITSWEEYLDAKILKIFNDAKDGAAKNLHLYDPEWMKANLGTPSDEEFYNEWLEWYQAQRKVT